jgi:hypothetical protein
MNDKIKKGIPDTQPEGFIGKKGNIVVRSHKTHVPVSLVLKKTQDQRI